MWQILQQDSPDDFIIATGETHTVREFVQAAFTHVNLDWKKYVKHDPCYERAAEVDILIGDSPKRKNSWLEPKCVLPRIDPDHGGCGHGTAVAGNSAKHLGKLP